jgi:hypothetical protein
MITIENYFAIQDDRMFSTGECTSGTLPSGRELDQEATGAGLRVSVQERGAQWEIRVLNWCGLKTTQQFVEVYPDFRCTIHSLSINVRSFRFPTFYPRNDPAGESSN